MDFVVSRYENHEHAFDANVSGLYLPLIRKTAEGRSTQEKEKSKRKKWRKKKRRARRSKKHQSNEKPEKSEGSNTRAKGREITERMGKRTEEEEG